MLCPVVSSQSLAFSFINTKWGETVRVGSLRRLNTLPKSAAVMPGINIALTTALEASGISRGTAKGRPG